MRKIKHFSSYPITKRPSSLLTKDNKCHLISQRKQVKESEG